MTPSPHLALAQRLSLQVPLMQSEATSICPGYHMWANLAATVSIRFIAVHSAITDGDAGSGATLGTVPLSTSSDMPSEPVS